MQSASSNFTQAASGGAVEWTQPRFFADWAVDGYGATGSIDDLSAQVGDVFTVVHSLDDGLPSDVSLSTTQDAVTLSVPLVYGRSNRASTYFSPYNGGSPVSGFDRDVAPVKLDWGLVTSAGQEFIRIFTGQMTNLRTRGQAAELTAVSATRLKLMKLVQPPAVVGIESGMNATWAISWTLAQCGIYLAPQPRSGCRMYMSMHGSLRPNIPARSALNQGGSLVVRERNSGATSDRIVRRGAFTASAPFLMAVNLYMTAAQAHFINTGIIDFDTGADLLSKAGNAGRVEFWIRGDSADVANAPQGSANVPMLAGMTFDNGGSLGKVTCGVSTTRGVFVTVADGTNTRTLTHSTVLPTDGAWHKVGAAYDVAGGKLWVFIDGVEQSSTVVLTTANLPPLEAFQASVEVTPTLYACLPIAEVHVTAGANASPVTAAWLTEVGFTAGATVRPSFLELPALAEPVPREAWELLGSIAQSELAQMRTDELDRFTYLPMSYWAEPAQQTVVDVISTSRNAHDIDVDLDPTKIRNSVSVNYPAVTVSDFEPYRSAVVVEIPPGTTTYRLYLDTPIVFGPTDFVLPNMAASDVNTASPDDAAYTLGFVTINSSSGGGGTYRTQTEVSATITDWTPGSILVQFQNNYGSTQYLSNGNSSKWPFISILCRFARSPTAAATGRETASITRRGERALAVTLPFVQDAATAQTIASELAARLSKARPTATDVTLFADPRRQPGDLVTLTDAVNTGASGTWRVQSITHERQGADYTQAATIRQALPVGLCDISIESDCIAGP